MSLSGAPSAAEPLDTRVRLLAQLWHWHCLRVGLRARLTTSPPTSRHTPSWPRPPRSLARSAQVLYRAAGARDRERRRAQDAQKGGQLWSGAARRQAPGRGPGRARARGPGRLGPARHPVRCAGKDWDGLILPPPEGSCCRRQPGDAPCRPMLLPPLHSLSAPGSTACLPAGMRARCQGCARWWQTTWTRRVRAAAWGDLCVVSGQLVARRAALLQAVPLQAACLPGPPLPLLAVPPQAAPLRCRPPPLHPADPPPPSLPLPALQWWSP